MKKAQIIECLVNDFEYEEKELVGRKKGELENILKGCVDSEVVLEQAIVEDGSEDYGVENVSFDGATVQEVAEETPEIWSPEWTPYVMTKFQESELVKGMPKVDGLRRVARMLLGPFTSFSDIYQCPAGENGWRATVKVCVSFKENNCLFYEGAADAYKNNTDSDFANHLVAVAETRAEGRALRKALHLTQILTAEELASPKLDQQDLIAEPAPPEMVEGVKIMCKRHGIDPFKLAISLNENLASLENLTMGDAKKIAEEINLFDNKKKEIPDNVKP